jgi:O-antigen ligase
MTEIIKNSIIGKIGEKVRLQWDKSLIKSLILRDTDYAIIKNSCFYLFVGGLINGISNLLDKASDIIDRSLSESILITAALRVGRLLARWFKNSAICAFIEKITECKFDFSGLRLYRILAFVLVFAAPIVPTMLCAAIAIASVGLYAIDCIRRKARPSKLDNTSFYIIALIAVFGFYAVFSLTPKSSIQIWLLYTVFMLFFFVVSDTADTGESLSKLAAVMVFSGLLVSLYGIYQWFFGDNTGHAWLDKEMFGDIALRVYSTLENPNVLGEYLLLMIPLCSALVWTRKTLLSRLYYFAVLALMLLCMLLTQSRGCWLGLILAAAIFAVLTDKRLVLLAAAVLFVLPFVLPESIIARFTSIGDLTDSSTSYRLYIWLGTLNMLKDFGIYGIGLGSNAFNKIYPFYSYSTVAAPHAHNIYLQLLCETGIVGLGLLLLTVVSALRKMLAVRISVKKGFSAVFSVAAVSALAGFMLQGAFDYVWYNYRVFLIFWIVMAAGINATPRLKQRQ